ncbi:hypothetical protein GEMRC1_008679 [Eukaryota sp. GEM-RC1]
MQQQIDALYERVKTRDPDQKEFLQAVEEVFSTLAPVLEKYPHYLPILETLIEPERMIIFRVPWMDKEGNIRVNRGMRVQFNSSLGPYKGGCRFHPSVNLSVIKFLGFEQIFKNALTGLPLGAGKGGADFDPKGKTEAEVMHFCQSFMTELQRYLGPNTDVPAGDIGVGAREVGYMFGQYKRIRNAWEGVLTGKGYEYGGSLIRPEATGYGAVYFADNMLKEHGLEIKGKRCVVSGAGNVAQFATEKLLDLGAIPITLSDSSGYIYEPEGITREKLAILMKLKNVDRARLSEYPKYSSTAKYFAGKRPWEVPCELAFPCATQNEISAEDATLLLKNGCFLVSEGANMPSVPAAIHQYVAAKGPNGIPFLYGPGKAANAGGVSVSGLEMTQNSMRLRWTREEVDEKLKQIMKNIFETARDTAADLNKPHDYMLGANCAGFMKVAAAMQKFGCH